MFVVKAGNYILLPHQKHNPCVERRIPHPYCEPYFSFASVIAYPHATQKVVARITKYAELFYVSSGAVRYILDGGEGHEVRAGGTLILPSKSVVLEHAVEEQTDIFRLAFAGLAGSGPATHIVRANNVPEQENGEHIIFHDTMQDATLLLARTTYSGGRNGRPDRPPEAYSVYFVLSGNGLYVVDSYPAETLNPGDTVFVPPSIKHSLRVLDGFSLELLRVDIR